MKYIDLRTFAFSKDQNTLLAYENELRNVHANKVKISDLEKSLSDFDKHLAEKLKHNEFIDSALAMRICAQAKALIKICKDNPRDASTPYLLAAVSYFVEQNDGHNDQDNIDGFEDDKLVIEAIIQKFNFHAAIQEILKSNDEGNKSA